MRRKCVIYPVAKTGPRSVIVEIVILAMIAAFLGLRLYSVLGRRAEHEEEIVPTRFDQGEQAGGQGRPAPSAQPNVAVLRPRELAGVPAAAEQGLRQIAEQDRSFELNGFLQGARAAYGMILEAFWRADREELKALCTPEVYDSFSQAIETREAAGETLDNRLIRIEEAFVRAATCEGGVARISVAFRADIAAVTRDRDGVVVAGSLDDAIESQDVWTFSRELRSAGPDWLLEETDAG